MIPGPVSVEDEVLHEMGSPVQAHYGPEWTAIYNETVGLLKQVFKTQGDVHILVGSGSAGVDAAIGSMTLPGDAIVVGSNGFFGDRLAEICQEYSLNLHEVRSPRGEPLNPADFADALRRYPEAAAVSVVHLETSTAVVNPVDEIAAVARAHSVPVIVDVISSLGGVPLETDAWGIDVCIGASQKCLGAPPGLAPIAVSPRAWEVMQSKPRRGHGWYLNLQTWRRFAEMWAGWHPFPVTMPTNNVLALRAGLRSLLAEGVQPRIQRYRGLALRLRHGLRRMRLEPFTPDERLAPVLTAVWGPEGIPTGKIVQYLLDSHGIKIAGGLGEGLSDRVFRVGHMGAKVCEADIDAVLEALGDFLAGA